MNEFTYTYVGLNNGQWNGSPSLEKALAAATWEAQKDGFLPYGHAYGHAITLEEFPCPNRNRDDLSSHYGKICMHVKVTITKHEDLGAAYSERVTRDRELTPEDEDLIRSMRRKNKPDESVALD